MINNKNHVEKIILTEKCNLNCKYCYQTNKKNISIDKEILLRRLDFLKEKLKNNEFNSLYISLFGGEPLLEKEKIKLIIDYFKEYNNVNFQITTNGLLFDEEYFNLFKSIKNNIEITISLDGREKGNILRTNKNNTKKIINNIQYLIKNNFNVNIFTCINKINKKYLLSDLNYFINKLKIPKISLFFVGCGVNKYNSYDLSFKEKKEIMRNLFPFYEKNYNIINIENDYLISKFFGQLNFKYYKPLNNNLNYVWVFQPNGFIYNFISNLGTNIEDCLQFQVDDKIPNLKEYFINKLINYNLIVPKEQIIKNSYELEMIANEKLYEQRSYELESMYFLVDEKCNLNCKYCYEKNKENNKMNLKDIDKFLKYLDDNYLCKTLVLFGGEPTLNPEACIKILKEAPPEIYVSMSTNGLIFNKEIAQAFLERERTWLQISLDGKYETMKERLGENKELFDLIIKNIEQYKTLKNHQSENNILNFHITLTTENLKYLYENIIFLLNLDFSHKINITPDFKGKWSKTDLFIYENQMNLIIDYIEKKYKNNNKQIPYINLLSLNCNDITHQPNQPCGAGINNLMINYKGDIYPCARLYSYSKKDFLLGNIYDNKPLNNSVFKNMNLNKSNPNECGKCRLPGCIRCYAANLEQTGKLDICNFNQCEIIKINQKLNQKMINKFGTREKGENWKK